MANVNLEDVSKAFGTSLVVDRANVEIPNGSFFSLLGPSGSGKTTLLRLIAGFHSPDSGGIFIGGQRVNRVPPHKRNIGMVFQNYALFPHRTVLENVAFGLKMRGAKREEVLKRSREALAMVRMESRESSYPHELSGGQQQRVAVARSIASRPAVWLLDEPLSALDRKLRVEMQVELRSLQRHLGITAVYVTHDQEEALAMSDSIAIFRDGKIAQQGTARDLYERPSNAFVADFLGSANLLDVVVRRAGNDWAAEIDGILMPVKVQNAIQDGSAAQLAVRPERVEIRTYNGAGGLPAVVESVLYLGSDLRVTLSTLSGAQIVARVASGGSMDRAGLEQGTSVAVTWQTGEAVIV